MLTNDKKTGREIRTHTLNDNPMKDEVGSGHGSSGSGEKWSRSGGILKTAEMNC